MGLPIDAVDVFNAGADAMRDQIHTSLPGKVVAYHPADQTADVQPMVKRCLFDDEGNKIYQSLPVLPSVPVMFMRGGGYAVTVPLAVGDFVWLMASESAMAEYLGTGQESEPWDTRRHHLSNCVAYPGCYPDTAPLTNAPTDGISLGKDTGSRVVIHPSTILLGADATDFVALASKVQTALDAIKLAFNTHMHATAGTGAPSPPTTATGIPIGTLGPVAAATVKAK